MAVASLKTWALKNRPINGRGIIRDSEIVSQTMDAYNKSYAGYGCDSQAIKPYCEPSCPVKLGRESNGTIRFGKIEQKKEDGPQQSNASVQQKY